MYSHDSLYYKVELIASTKHIHMVSSDSKIISVGIQPKQMTVFYVIRFE